MINIRNDRGNITMDPSDIRRIVTDYNEHPKPINVTV